AASPNARRCKEPSRKPRRVAAPGRGGGVPSRRDCRGTAPRVGRSHARDLRGFVGTKRGVAPSRLYFSAASADGVTANTTPSPDSCPSRHELNPAESHLPLAHAVHRHPTPGTLPASSPGDPNPEPVCVTSSLSACPAATTNGWGSFPCSPC